MTITLHRDVSILEADQDVIVNPANGHLRHGGGLARIIENAANGEFVAAQTPNYPNCTVPQIRKAAEDAEIGRLMWQCDHEQAPLVPTGGVHVTSAGRLPHKAVIHAVGPIYRDGNFMEHDLLEVAHIEVFDTAEKSGWSVAVPAISCGIFLFPVTDAAKIAIEAASWYPDLDVHFYLMGDEHYDAYVSAYGEICRKRHL